MKKILKVALPTLLLLAFGISAMLIVTSCKKEPGSKCSSCTSTADCNAGLQCFTMTNGGKKCVAKAGDLCIGI
jgi:hypothetical protein